MFTTTLMVPNQAKRPNITLDWYLPRYKFAGFHGDKMICNVLAFMHTAIVTTSDMNTIVPATQIIRGKRCVLIYCISCEINQFELVVKK